jgi:flagellar basal-body rod protein FlgG
MAITALHSASTGLSGLQTQIDVISNNLSNVNTTGFKSARVNFEDLMYQQKAQPGVENANGDQRPSGIEVGLGTRVANTQRNFSTGSPVKTGQALDFFIKGDGFFKVNIRQQDGTGIGYTRAGNFFKNAEGDLVLGNSNGPRLEPPINIPEDTTKISVSSDGIVRAHQPGQVQPQEVGQLELANFVNPAGLKGKGGNIYVETPASGPPINGTPGEGNFGTIKQNMLEGSNVDPVKELVDLIKTQRAFEFNSQSIKAADQALRTIGNLSRF